MADSHEEHGSGVSGGQYLGPTAHTSEPVADPHDDPAYITRTKFLSGVAVLTGAVMGAAILVPVVGFAVADTVKEENWRWIDIGPLSDYPEGVSSVAVSGPFPESDRRAFIRHRDNSIIAIWNRCAHLGCPSSYSQGSDSYTCPCHGGSYDSLGRVIAGPPPRPLDRFDVKIARADGSGDVAKTTSPAEGVSTAGAAPEDRVLIGIAFSIDEDQNPYRLHGPGEEVTGVLANLYPF